MNYTPKIKELLSNGKNIIEIAKIYGVHRATIANWMKKWGINKNQLRLNHSFFSNIKTEKQAYWLGYIYADGSVVTSEKTIPRVDITSKDIDHLHIWHKDLESCNKITIIKPKIGSIYGRSMNRSQQMVNDLIALGCIPIKTGFYYNKNRNCYKIYKNKKSELRILYNYFYDNSAVFLQRKKEVWDNVIV